MREGRTSRVVRDMIDHAWMPRIVDSYGNEADVGGRRETGEEVDMRRFQAQAGVTCALKQRLRDSFVDRRISAVCWSSKGRIVRTE